MKKINPILHIKAKKIQTIILASILFFISILMLVGIGIYDSTNKSIKDLEDSLGGSFTIDVKQYTRDERPDLFKSYIGLDGKEYYWFYSKVALTDTIVNKIMKIGGIKEYNNESGVCVYLRNSILKGGLYTGLLDLSKPGEKGYESYWEIASKISTIHTVNNSSLNSYFRNGTLTLIEGRGIQEGDQYKVIISNDFSKRNNLKVGDKISTEFYNEYTSKDDFEIIKDNELEIVGIFKVNTIQGNNDLCLELDILENSMFSDFSIQQSANDCGFVKNQLESSKTMEYWAATTFFVKDPKQLDSIINKVKKSMGNDLEYWDIKKDDTNYKSSVEPLTSMKKIIVASLIIVCGTSVILLSLLSTMWMLERKREISILLSLGKSKTEVLARFLAEYLILSTVAILIAFLLSTAVSNKLGNQLLNFVSPTENTSDEETSLDETDYVDEAGNVDLKAIGDDAVAFETPSQTPDSIEITIGVREFVIVFGIEWAILGISVLRMGNRLWKMKPREIISDLS